MIVQSASTIAAAPDDVYRLLLDLETVARCIPGATITGRRGDGSYDAEVSFGPGSSSSSYRGTVSVEERDDAERSARLHATMDEAGGDDTARAVLTLHVAAGDGGTSQVSISTDLVVTGRAARIAQGVVQDAATRLTAGLAHCIEKTLRAATTSPRP